MFVGCPTGTSWFVAGVQRVRVSIETEHRLAGEREVGVVERLAVTKADKWMKHGAERLLGADVADSGHQVAVRLQETGQSSIGDRGSEFEGGGGGEWQIGGMTRSPHATNASVQPAYEDVYDVGVKLNLHEHKYSNSVEKRTHMCFIDIGVRYWCSLV